MKKLILAVVFIVGIVTTACHDNEPLSAEYIRGKWEVEMADHPEYTTIYDFTTIKGFDDHGLFEVYYLTTDGQTVTKHPVNTYEWYAYGPQNNNGILDISYVPIDTNDGELMDVFQCYIITDISSQRMTWKRTIPNDGLTVCFIRRDDL